MDLAAGCETQKERTPQQKHYAIPPFPARRSPAVTITMNHNAMQCAHDDENISSARLQTARVISQFKSSLVPVPKTPEVLCFQQQMKGRETIKAKVQGGSEQDPRESHRKEEKKR